MQPKQVTEADYQRPIPTMAHGTMYRRDLPDYLTRGRKAWYNGGVRLGLGLGRTGPTRRTKHEAAMEAKGTKKAKQAVAEPTPEQATPETVAQTSESPKAEAKPKSPEQQAAAMRRQAGELRRSAQAVNEAEGGPLQTRANQLEQDADALSPKKSKAKSTELRPTCKGTKKDGTPCTAKAMEGSDFCTDHRPVRDRFTDEQWAAINQLSPEVLVERLGWGVTLKLVKEHLGQASNSTESK